MVHVFKSYIQNVPAQKNYKSIRWQIGFWKKSLNILFWFVQNHCLLVRCCFLFLRISSFFVLFWLQFQLWFIWRLRRQRFWAFIEWDLLIIVCFGGHTVKTTHKHSIEKWEQWTISSTKQMPWWIFISLFIIFRYEERARGKERER